MSSQRPPLGSPVPEPEGDVDAFSWRNVTPRTRLAMKRLLGLRGDSDIALAARFATPPSAEVVDACWTVLRDTWLASASPRQLRSAKRVPSYAAREFESAYNASVNSWIVRQSKSETWVAHVVFDVEGVGALAAPIVGVVAAAGSVRPDAHLRTRSLASRIPRVRASDQSSRAIC